MVAAAANRTASRESASHSTGWVRSGQERLPPGNPTFSTVLPTGSPQTFLHRPSRESDRAGLSLRETVTPPSLAAPRNG